MRSAEEERRLEEPRKRLPRRLPEPAEPSLPTRPADPAVNRHFRTSRPTNILNLGQNPASRKQRASSQQPAAAAPEDDQDARFKDLPKVFIRSATPAELARWFDMHRRSLANRYIRPLLEAGLLERQFPDNPNTPKQAYRTRREDPGRSEAGTGRLSIAKD